MTRTVAGGSPGKRELRKEGTGRAGPGKATTTRKKNSQRGQSSGSEKFNRANRPPQPTSTKRSVVGRKESGEGVRAGIMGWNDYKRGNLPGSAITESEVLAFKKPSTSCPIPSCIIGR